MTELIDKAINRANELKDTADAISRLDEIITKSENGEVVVYKSGSGIIYLNELSKESKQKLLDTVRTALINTRNEKVAKLEELMGFRKPDPVVIAKNYITGDEIIKTDSSDRKSRSRYPENMTVETVTRMYVAEGKNRREIADYFGVKESTVNNFLYLHGIRRNKREKKPDEKECP